MTTVRVADGWWTRWTRATALGWVAGFVLMLVLLVLLEGLGLAGQLGIGLGMGAGVGLLQARAIGPLIGARTRWTAATILGVALPFLAFDLASLAGAPVPWSLPAAVVLAGLCAGLMQRPLLAPLSDTPSGWLGASLLGWALAGSMVVLGELLPRTPGVFGALRYIAVILLGGVLLGAVQGLALGRLLRKAPALS